MMTKDIPSFPFWVEPGTDPVSHVAAILTARPPAFYGFMGAPNGGTRLSLWWNSHARRSGYSDDFSAGSCRDQLSYSCRQSSALTNFFQTMRARKPYSCPART